VNPGMMLEDTKRGYSRFKVEQVPMLVLSMNLEYIVFNVFQKLRKMVEYIHQLLRLQ
jgi:hypothetical protein